MEFKLGGGRHMQPYDPENGQYTDSDVFEIGEKDMENLVLVYLFGLDYDHLKFHFPNYKIHDRDYCEMFVKYIRRFIRNEDTVIDESKILYFLTKLPKNDKSNFFAKTGYEISNCKKMINDIRCGTEFEKSEFKKITDKSFNIQTKTALNGYIVTSAWQILEDGTVRLITLIPGGDKIWK